MGKSTEKTPTLALDRLIVQPYLITTAKYDFTTYEKRILTQLIEQMQPLIEGRSLVGKVQRTLFGDYGFDFPISFFADGDSNQARFKQALKDLNNKKFEYEDENCWRIIRLIEMPKIEKHGNVKFTLSEQLVELFLNFSKGYSKYMLNISLALRSVYAMRLYELISNQQKPLTFKIERLKEMWQVTDKYTLNANFINKCIKQAKKELDETANWSFDFEPIKRGQKYTYIKFTPIHFAEREPKEIQDAELKRRVNLSWSIVERDIRNFLKKECSFSDREIKNNIASIQKFIRTFADNSLSNLMEIWSRSQDKRNPKGYLIGVIKLETE